MAKMMKIVAHVDEAAFGRVVNVLNAMPGVARLDLDLKRNQANQDGTIPGAAKMSGRALILVALSAKGKQCMDDLRTIFRDAGLADSSALATIGKLKRDKLARSTKVAGRKACYELTPAGKKAVAAATNQEG
ncbi:MAG: hypothetical protein EHM78_02340 [Myxococcaceae bacterium]|nr:MAG: hypothetical protein EHM78_02340 [Myxococcaceae bacterium]